MTAKEENHAVLSEAKHPSHFADANSQLRNKRIQEQAFSLIQSKSLSEIL
ncbi:hypothetical protein [Azospirillum argentinense]